MANGTEKATELNSLSLGALETHATTLLAWASMGRFASRGITISPVFYAISDSIT
jgi:hypothetical protein